MSLSNTTMRVMKRNGLLEEISFDKILTRMQKLGKEATIKSINYHPLIVKVIDQLYDKIPTTKIDELSAEQCASLSTIHPDYHILSGRIVVSNHQKNTSNSFKKVMQQLYEFKDKNGKHCPIISEAFWKLCEKHSDYFDSILVHERDYLIDYFGFRTMEKSYLFKINGVAVERIQHLWLRVSLAIHGDDLNLVKETYDLMSQKYFVHATPTLFNAGTNKQQLSSCYLLAMESDSLEGIYDTLKDCARISKWSGGIGLHIHNIRGKNALIRGTNGQSTGIVPMLTVFEKTARFINQGTKRNGSFSIYLEPWHPDIEDFLNLKKNHGDEDMRARFMFYGLWVPDLFMEKVRDNDSWCLFCPSECSGLDDAIGVEFKALYEKYESEGKQRSKMLARDLWYKILDAQMETGTPYLLFKDQCNRKSNQQNLGTIKSSNLCTEIIEYSDDTESAVCNLASISLPAFVDSVNHTFNYEALHKVVKTITTNLNKIIDINFYPTVKTQKSNLLHRPIGIGVQGLADAFILMDIPFYSEDAKTVNKHIFETMYHASLEKSNELARERSEWFVPLVQKVWDEIKNYGGGIYELIEGKPLFEKVDFIYQSVDKGGNVYNKHFYNENINYGELTQYINLKISDYGKDISQCNRCGSYSSFQGSPASQGKLQFDLWNHKVTDERYDWASLKEKIGEYGLRNSLLIAPMPTASTSQILGNNECFEPLTSNMYSRSTLAGEFIMANKYLMNDLIKLDMWNEKIKNNIVANNGSIQHILTIPEKIRDKYKIVWEIPMKHLIDMSADRGVFICQSQSLNLWQEDPNYKTLTSMHFYSWKKGLKTGIYYLRRKAKHQAQQFTVEPVQQDSKQEEHDEICEMCSA